MRSGQQHTSRSWSFHGSGSSAGAGWAGCGSKLSAGADWTGCGATDVEQELGGATGSFTRLETAAADGALEVGRLTHGRERDGEGKRRADMSGIALDWQSDRKLWPEKEEFDYFDKM